MGRRPASMLEVAASQTMPIPCFGIQRAWHNSQAVILPAPISLIWKKLDHDFSFALAIPTKRTGTFAMG